MFSNQSTDLHLDAPCRALDAVPRNDDEPSWIAGSCSLSNHNALYHIRYHSEANEITKQKYTVDAPVKCVACIDDRRVLTTFETGSAAVLWKLPEQASSSHDELVELASLRPDGGFGACIVDLAIKSPQQKEDGPLDVGSNSTGDLLTLDSNGHLTVWDMEGQSQLQNFDTTTFDTIHRHAKWDPHNEGAAAVSTGKSVTILDLRTDVSVPTGTVETVATQSTVTDLDYNPNKPYVLATSHENGHAHIWDVRHCGRPLLTLRGGHSHWMNHIRYNPFHDQLVASTGTDRLVNVWRLSTVSSAPLLLMESQSMSPNVRIVRHEHGDTVYAPPCWSRSDAWMYLTVSFDGNAVLYHVPSKEKYKILL